MKNTYNGWGQATTKTQPWISSGAEQDVSTSSSYFPNTGYLKSVNGPLNDSGNPAHKDQVDYTYDLVGRLATSTMWTSPSTSYTTSQTYASDGL